MANSVFWSPFYQHYLMKKVKELVLPQDAFSRIKRDDVHKCLSKLKCYINKCKVVITHACLVSCSVLHVWLFVTSWTAACQAPLSMEFSRREYCSELPFLSQAIFPTQGRFSCVSSISYICMWVRYHCIIWKALGFHKKTNRYPISIIWALPWIKHLLD